MESGPPRGTFQATDFMFVIIAEPVTDLAIGDVPRSAKSPIVTGYFPMPRKHLTLIGANDPHGLDNPLAELLVEAPHQVPDGVPEHAHEGR